MIQQMLKNKARRDSLYGDLKGLFNAKDEKSDFIVFNKFWDKLIIIKYPTFEEFKYWLKRFVHFNSTDRFYMECYDRLYS